MNNRQREVRESPLYQGEDESIAYTINTAAIHATEEAALIVVVVKDVNADEDEQDVTAEVMPTNTPAADGTVITLSPLRDLSRGRKYRVEVAFTILGNRFEVYFVVFGQE